MISVKTDTLNVPITDISHVIIPTKLCSDSRLYGCTLTAHFFFLVNYNSIFIRAFSRLMILLNLRIILLFFIKTILNRAVSDKNVPPHKVLLELCRKKIRKYRSAPLAFPKPKLTSYPSTVQVHPWPIQSCVSATPDPVHPRLPWAYSQCTDCIAVPLQWFCALWTPWQRVWRNWRGTRRWIKGGRGVPSIGWARLGVYLSRKINGTLNKELCLYTRYCTSAIRIPMEKWTN